MTPRFRPTRAMVLAAGLGLRMRPLTLDRPKPLIAVAGRTLLDHVLDRLGAAGVTRVVVNTHYKGEQIAAHLRGRTDLAVELSPEAELLDTGGGVKNALPRLGAEPFYVVNADNVWLDGPTPALTRLAAAWDPARMDILMLLAPSVLAVGYEGRGDYFLDPEGRCRRRRGQEIAPFVFAGVQIVSPSAFADTPAGAFSNTLVWDRAEEAGRLYGLRHDGVWLHVGTPEALGEAEARLAGGMARWMER